MSVHNEIRARCAAELDHRRRSMARSLSEGDDISMAVNGETGRIVTRDER